MGLQIHLHLPHLLILIISCTIPASAIAAHLNNQTDLQALLAFKDQISKDPHNVLSSWNASLHFCNWHGVSCGRRHQRVIALNLSTLHLVGRISPYIANLSFLRSIHLPNNSFHGEIPSEMGRLFRLQSLNLRYNSLEGAIPARLSNCSHLTLMQLAFNKLEGEVPSEIGFLSKLTVLSIASNNFTGVFPAFVVNLSSLARFSIAANNFHGTIPKEVGMLSGLGDLFLASNNFSGELPLTIYNLSNIEFLVLDNNRLSGRLSPHMGYFFPYLLCVHVYLNQFTGTIPNSLCNASQLQEIDFGDNLFVGSVPSDLGKLQDLNWIIFIDNELGTEKGDDLHFITSLTNCSRLEVLVVERNQLSGPLPASFANLSTSLIYLSLGHNQIYGRIPSGIENILNLGKFGLHGNLLSGPIPDGLGKLQNLGGLYLNNNSLSGQIPNSLGNLSHLVQLYLWKNQLHGSIPLSLGNCSSLQYLYLFNNNLDGSIPSQLFNLRSMVFLNLSTNFLSGNLPMDVGQLQNLNALDVSNNRLSGAIPNSLGKCSSLVLLYLSHNSFEGTIPMSLTALRGVQEIDFSQNNLSGKIPAYFIEFTQVRLLNFSSNHLEGEVPTQGPFGNASKISVMGNSKLCGGIRELYLHPCPKDGRKSYRQSFLLKLMLPLTIGTCIVLVPCCIFLYYWRKQPRDEQSPFLTIKEKHMKVTFAELFQATNGFSSANMIGSGSFGSVYKGNLDSYQTDIAVKVIRTEHMSLQIFMAECEALKKIRHRNIVKILTSCSSLDFQGKDFKALVFKFMSNGNLESWLHPHADQDFYLSLSKRLDVAIDIAHALDYLHNHCETPIVHCDLKPNNVLLDEDMIAHVSDFGLAKILSVENDDSSYASMLKGSIGYIPPEYGTSNKVTTQGDVYSYGVLLLEMLMGKRPTDQVFNDGVNISKYAQMSFPEKMVEIVDPRLLLREDVQNNVQCQGCFLSAIRLGIACTAESPHDRKNIRDVCTELQAIREVFHKSMLS